LIVTGHLLEETLREQPAAQILGAGDRARTEGDVRILSAQRLIGWGDRLRALTVEAMGPSTDEYDLAEPWTKSVDQE
jgi:hypothetical protein